jgi:hypothetical protein
VWRLGIVAALDKVCKTFTPPTIFDFYSLSGSDEEKWARRIAGNALLNESKSSWHPATDPATPILVEIRYGYLEPLNMRRKLANVLRKAAWARSHFGPALGTKLHENAEDVLKRIEITCAQAFEGFRFRGGSSGYRCRAALKIDMGAGEEPLELCLSAEFDIGAREGNLDLYVLCQCCERTQLMTNLRFKSLGVIPSKLHRRNT